MCIFGGNIEMCFVHTVRFMLNVPHFWMVKLICTFHCRATELTSEQYYMFSVTAQTRLGWGKTANALVFTTNNRERPQPPSVPQISPSQIQSEQITFSWTPGRDGFSPLRYVVDVFWMVVCWPHALFRHVTSIAIFLTAFYMMCINLNHMWAVLLLKVRSITIP